MQLDAQPGTAPDALSEEEMVLEVVSIDRLSSQIVSIEFQRPDCTVFPAWEPGAHIDLILPDVVTRQYSLCGHPEDRFSWRIAALREPDSRGGSVYLHDTLEVGDQLSARGPRNHFALAGSPRYIFAAGGIGITPLLPMARRAEEEGRDWQLIYCARSRSAMAFLPEIQDLLPDSRVIVNADDESGLFDFDAHLGEPQVSTAVYACGPAPFLDALATATEHWPVGSLRVERFEPIEYDNSKNHAFEVELATSGRVLTVGPNESVLDVVRAAGIPILSSCSEGTCGTCETAVISGDIDHRDSVLSEEERASGEMMMVCVSRCARNRLVLDL